MIFLIIFLLIKPLLSLRMTPNFTEPLITPQPISFCNEILTACTSGVKIGKWNSAVPRCKVLQISRKKTPITSSWSYTLNGHQLEYVPSINDLGITITSDLSKSRHIELNFAKDNKTLGLLEIICYYQKASLLCVYSSEARVCTLLDNVEPSSEYDI